MVWFIFLGLYNDCKLKGATLMFLQVMFGSRVVATFDPPKQVGFKVVLFRVIESFKRTQR